MVTCPVTFILPTPLTGTSITLEASATAQDNTSATVNSTATNPTATVKFGQLSITAATTTATTPLTIGQVASINVTIGNDGPIAVTDAIVSVGGTALTCSSSLNVPAADTTATPATTMTANCVGSYTVKPADVAATATTSTPKALAVTVASATSAVTLTATTTVSIPVVLPLQTTFGTSDCQLVPTGSPGKPDRWSTAPLAGQRGPSAHTDCPACCAILTSLSSLFDFLFAAVWSATCTVTVTNASPNTDLAGVTVQFSKANDDYPASTTASCTVGATTTTVAQGAGLGMGTYRKCVVSATLNATDITAGTVSLKATAVSTTAGLLAGTESNVTLKLGVVTVTGATTASSTAPATLGSVVPVTITITNTGPIAINGITVTPPAGVNLTGTTCAAPVNTTAATNTTPTAVTCAATYTVTSSDVLASTKTLDFTVAIDDSAKIEAPPTSASISVPLTNLTTSITASSCTLVPGECRVGCAISRSHMWALMHVGTHACSSPMLLCWPVQVVPGQSHAPSPSAMLA